MDYFCLNCGERTGMYGHAFGPEAKADGGYSCEPNPERVAEQREAFRKMEDD